MATRDYKIILIGDSGVGKSSLVHWFLHQKFDEFIGSTIGTSFCTKRMRLDDGEIKLNIWDTAGQERFRSLVKIYYKNTAGCFCVFDVTKSESFANLRYWLDGFKSGNGISNSNILIIGNKSDMDPAKWKVDIESIEKICVEYKCDYVLTSCIDGSNVMSAFDRMANSIYHSNPPIPDDETFNRDNLVKLAKPTYSNVGKLFSWC